MNRTGFGVVVRASQRLFSCIRSFSGKSKMSSADNLDIKQLRLVKPMVGIVQMTSSPDKDATLAQLTALVERAKAKGAQIVFVPEAADYIAENKEVSAAMAESIDGNIVSRYKELAGRLNIWLSIGSFHEKPADAADAKRVFNTQLMIDNMGTIKAIYRKVHMFDVDVPGNVPMRESAYTIPGDKIGPPILTPAGSVGMAVCYDMRFPEQGIMLANQGAEILIYPSAFMVQTGMAHWDVLLRARAIENQCYVIAAAQVGQNHSKRQSYGNAMAVDAWGTVIAKCHDKPDVCVVEIDLPLLQKRRLEMPIANQKRHDVYDLHHSLKIPIAEVGFQFGPHVITSSSVFYTTSGRSFAFVNRKPVVPGHVLVSPMRPSARFADMTAAEVSDLFLTVQRVSNVVQSHWKASSVTIAIQDGPDSGQSVAHVHVHVVPRKSDDFPQTDDIYDKLQHHDKDDSAARWRTEEAMATEATALRSYFN